MFLLITGNAQNKTIDSLLTVLKRAGADTTKVKTLVRLNSSYLDINENNNALKYANQALSLSTSLKFSAGIGKANEGIGLAHYYNGDFADAINSYSAALKIWEQIGNKPEVASMHNLLGNAYFRIGNYPESLKEHLISLKMNKELGDQMAASYSYNNIGNTYAAQNDLDQALDNYLAALTILKGLGPNTRQKLSFAYGNIGNIYLQQKKFDLALNYFNLALDIMEEKNDLVGVATTVLNIGNTYKIMQKYDEALKNYTSGLKMFEETGDKQGVAMTKVGMAEVLFSKADSIGGATARRMYADAEKLAKSSLDLSLEMGDLQTQKDGYGILYEISERLNDKGLSLEYFKKYIKARDSLINEANTEKTVRLEMNYGFEKKETEIRLEQEKKDALAQQEKHRQAVIRNIILLGFLIVLVLLVFIFRGYKQKQKDNLIIIAQKEEVEKAKEIIEDQKKIVEEKQTAMIDSINYALKLQQAILPKLEVVHALFPNNFVLYLPKDIVAGDFYWTTENDNYYFIAICDCTGHGVPGAFMSLLNIGFLSEAIKERNIFEPNKILDYVRTQLIKGIGNEGQQDGMDGILMRFNKKDRRVCYAAANNAPVLIRQNKLEVLRADKMPVGKGPKMDPFTLFELELQKNDTMYLFTDGFADQFGGPLGKKFKNRQLEDLILSGSVLPPSEQHAQLLNTFNTWKGQLEQVDDVLIMGIKV